MVDIDTYIAMVSDDYREPLYFAKVLSKHEAETEIHDKFGYTIFPGEMYLNVFKTNKIQEPERKTVLYFR